MSTSLSGNSSVGYVGGSPIAFTSFTGGGSSAYGYVGGGSSACGYVGGGSSACGYVGGVDLAGPNLITVDFAKKEKNNIVAELMTVMRFLVEKIDIPFDVNELCESPEYEKYKSQALKLIEEIDRDKKDEVKILILEDLYCLPKKIKDML